MGQIGVTCRWCEFRKNLKILRFKVGDQSTSPFVRQKEIIAIKKLFCLYKDIMSYFLGIAMKIFPAAIPLIADWTKYFIKAKHNYDHKKFVQIDTSFYSNKSNHIYHHILYFPKHFACLPREFNAFICLSVAPQLYT
jgi:hypothetical protein